MPDESMSVLLVDDDEDDHILTRALLTRACGPGLRLDWARSRAEAAEAIRRGGHDVVLVDYRLGADDGLGVIRDAVAAGCAAPLVLLTGQGDPEVDRAAMQAGAADYLVKGRFDAEALERSLRYAIRQKRAEAALRVSEGRYRLLFEVVPQATLVYDAETLAVLDANPAAIALYGYAREEFLALTLADIRPAEDVPKVWQWHREHAGEPRAEAGGRHRKRDGTVFEVEVTSSLLGGTTRVAVIRDVTERRRAEAAVLESERFARGVLDSLSAHIAVVGGDGRIEAVNRSWREFADGASSFAGHPTAEGANYLAACDAAGTAVAAEFAAGLRDVLAGRRPIFIHEDLAPTPAGGRWLLRRVTPFRGGGPPRAVVAHIDVTERRRADEALRRSEQTLQAVIDSSKAVIYLRDLEGRFLLVNRRFEALFGAAVGPLVGKTAHDLFPAGFAEAFIAGDRRALEAGTSIELEEVAPHADGLRTYLSIKAPLLDRDGVPYAICGISTDITERKRIEEALRQSEARFRGAFDAAAVGMAIVSPEGRCLEANRSLCEILGYSAGEMIGRTIEQLTYPEDLGEDLELMHRTLAGEIRAYRLEKRYVRKDGRVIWALMSVALVRDGRGAPLHFVPMVEDITPRKEAEEALRQSERRFRAVFGGSLDGIVIVDDQGRYVDVNPAAAELFGLPREQLIGRSIVEFAEPGYDFAGMWTAFLRRENETGDFRLVRPDGSTRDLEYSARAHVLPGQHLSVLRDVTERRRAERALGRYVGRLTHLRRLDQSILAARHPREIAEAALEHLRQHVGCWNASLYLIDLRRLRLRVLAASGADRAIAAGATAPLEALGAEEIAALRAGTPHAVEDVRALARPSAVAAALIDEGMRSYARIPLRAQGRLIGTLNLCSDRPGRFDDEQLEVAGEIANQLAIAIQSARLFDQVRRGRRRLAALSRRLIATQEAERRHLARELHDEVGQSLTALKLNIQAAAAAGPADRAALAQEGRLIIDGLIGQVRDMSLELRPSMLDDLGLVPTLRWYADRIARNAGLEVRLAVDAPEARAPAAVETACFRIAQEALTNVARHARARHALVELELLGDALVLTIRDDGEGFDPHAGREISERGAGLGLLGMRERAALLGGRLEIDSALGCGCTVRLTLPLDPPAPPNR